jgi:HD superfamily phosphohydrolase
MPTAHLVYPSAKHTRKTHSLGVMQLAHDSIAHLLFLQDERISSKISSLFWQRKVVTKGPRERNLTDMHNLPEGWWCKKDLDHIVQGIRLAAMLHDLGHAPFSHLFEDVCKAKDVVIDFKDKKTPFDHEIMSRKIIEEKETELGVLKPFTFDYINDVLDKESGKAPLFVKEIINSGYDCDKMDYLRRDAYATGTLEFGRLDHCRIISGFRVFDERLCVSTSAIDALMNSFDALKYMYTSVYYHRTTRIFDFMIEDALSKVPEFLQDIVSNTDRFLEFNDHNFIARTIDYVKNKDAVEILNDFLNRKLRYVEVFSHRLTSGFLLIEKTNNALEELRRELNELAEHLEIRIDFRPKIRPVGIDLDRLSSWLMEERIYDPESGEAKTLYEVSRAFHDSLKHYTILFRVYANRLQLDPTFDTTNLYRSERDQIVKTAKEKIKSIEDQYDKL